MDHLIFWKKVEDLCKQYKDISFYLEDNDADDEVYISGFMRLRPYQSEKGLGKKFMNKFISLCDRYGINCELSVEEWLAKDVLTEYYQQFGFEEVEVIEGDSIRMRRICS